jgi:hypothetical protein
MRKPLAGFIKSGLYVLAIAAVAISMFNIGQCYHNTSMPPEIDNSKYKLELINMKENQQLLWAGVLIDVRSEEKYLVTSNGRVNIINKMNRE